MLLSSVTATREQMALCVQLEKVQFRDVTDLHQALLGFVKTSALCDGLCVVVRALPAVTALLHRRRKNRNLYPVVCHLSWVTPVKGLCKTALVLSKGRSTSWPHSLEKFGATKMDKLQKSLVAEDRGLGHEPHFIATLGGQRDELVRVLLPFIAILGDELFKFTWRPSETAGCSPRSTLLRCGSSYRSVFAAVTQMVAAIGMAAEELGAARYGGAVVFRSITGPLMLFQCVLGARWVPVGTGPSDAPTLLEAAPDRRNNAACGTASHQKLLIGAQEARPQNTKKKTASAARLQD